MNADERKVFHKYARLLVYPLTKREVPLREHDDKELRTGMVVNGVITDMEAKIKAKFRADAVEAVDELFNGLLSMHLNKEDLLKAIEGL